MTSQHPYAEVFVGRPHVYTVDIRDANAVKQAMDEMSKLTVWFLVLSVLSSHVGLHVAVSLHVSVLLSVCPSI